MSQSRRLDWKLTSQRRLQQFIFSNAMQSFGAIFHQVANEVWRDPLDQQWKQIEPSQLGEKERYFRINIVKDDMKTWT